MTVLVPLLILGLLVFFHELGHFFLAKRAGIHVHELAFGMGPRLIAQQRGETTYSLRVLPFGGFVRMASAAESAEADEPPISYGRTFESRPIRTRVAVIAAGPVMNFILAVLLLTLVFGAIGFDQANLDSTVLGEVLSGGPAHEAGLRPGDRIASIDGVPVTDWRSMVLLVQGSLGREVAVGYERDGQLLVVRVATAPHPQDPAIGYLGVATSVVRTLMPLPQALAYSFGETVRMLTMWIGAIVGIFMGRGTPDVSGPVGIIQMLGEASQFGLASVFYLAAIISANFAMINLLPIPALDGSRLIFLGVEALRGRPVAPENEGRVHLIGYGLLMTLLVLLTYRDLMRLGGGGQ